MLICSEQFCIFLIATFCDVEQCWIQKIIVLSCVRNRTTIYLCNFTFSGFSLYFLSWVVESFSALSGCCVILISRASEPEHKTRRFGCCVMCTVWVFGRVSGQFTFLLSCAEHGVILVFDQGYFVPVLRNSSGKCDHVLLTCFYFHFEVRHEMKQLNTTLNCVSTSEMLALPFSNDEKSRNEMVRNEVVIEKLFYRELKMLRSDFSFHCRSKWLENMTWNIFATVW